MIPWCSGGGKVGKGVEEGRLTAAGFDFLEGKEESAKLSHEIKNKLRSVTRGIEMRDILCEVQGY